MKRSCDLLYVKTKLDQPETFSFQSDYFYLFNTQKQQLLLCKLDQVYRNAILQQKRLKGT